MEGGIDLGVWRPLTIEGLAEAADAPAAVQLRRQEGLVAYPTGKSAMVFYFYARTSARAALTTHFADEIERPGARGQGPLLFRFSTEAHAERALSDLLDAFVARFGRAPVLHDP